MQHMQHMNAHAASHHSKARTNTASHAPALSHAHLHLHLLNLPLHHFWPSLFHFRPACVCIQRNMDTEKKEHPAEFYPSETGDKMDVS